MDSRESNLCFSFRCGGCATVSARSQMPQFVVLRCKLRLLPPMGLLAVALDLWASASSGVRYLQVALVWLLWMSKPHLKQ